MSTEGSKNRFHESPPAEGYPQDGVGKSKQKTFPKNSVLTYINSTPIFRHFTPFLPREKSLNYRARGFKKAGNRPEIVFWQQVHKRKFYNIDFDRQRVIGNYIVDFYVKSLSLVVEIDRASHNDKEYYDKKRDKYLQNLGLKVYHVSATDVIMDVEMVMILLEEYILQNYS